MIQLFYIQAEVTMKTNFFGTQDVGTELLPLVKAQGEPDEGAKLWCVWHDLVPDSLFSSVDRWPLALLSHTGLLAVPPPEEVSLCLRALTHLSCSQHCPLSLCSFTRGTVLSFKSSFKTLPREPFAPSMPLTMYFPGIPPWTLSFPSPLNEFIQTSGLHYTNFSGPSKILSPASNISRAPDTHRSLPVSPPHHALPWPVRLGTDPSPWPPGDLHTHMWP